jgi:hypothetical protein
LRRRSATRAPSRPGLRHIEADHDERTPLAAPPLSRAPGILGTGMAVGSFLPTIGPAAAQDKPGAGFAWDAFTGFAFGFAAGAAWGWGWGAWHGDVNININNNSYNHWSHNVIHTASPIAIARSGPAAETGSIAEPPRAIWRGRRIWQGSISC